ncbi:hypothetical protein FRZ44_13300 [Hypericibacter terrae]|uniref:DUF4325 domain-containing protein n=1 Tax=Hypericibacter terrae TaxID=2602015 RepID=A0A5J6MEY3_9PROT|nr:STAS-like domain-containing protein [Hypericibacter terrae]QEX16038.1 hypothetical protein FRZ44_13300 [Hypericibacter terrae]
MHDIAIARDFSEVPAGRFERDGPFSGEAFRERHLKPALSAGQAVVNLDGTEGYGSSFLEEAFGGLVRRGYFSASELHKRLKIVSRDQALVDEVWEYIDRAKNPSAN